MDIPMLHKTNSTGKRSLKKDTTCFNEVIVKNDINKD